ncbi:MAG: serine hydrolase [Actinomycetota bacterium]|nr:serine hydrolase [Actinomycetota bacterium]MEE2631303.1 serine hydrolase [Actinomycetota bacterium]
MLTPRLVVTMVSPETGRLRPTELDVLPEPLTAAEHGLMVGSPPPADKRVHHGNWMAWPHIRWALTHMDELRASGRISRGDDAATGLATASPAETGLDLDGLSIDDGGGGTWTLDEMLSGTYTDAFLVLHRGRVVLERYFNGMGQSTRHAMFSMTKTVTGVLALLAVDDGMLGLDDPLTDHVPELSHTAFAPVTVGQALDMTDGIRFVEDYSDNRSDIMRYGTAMAFTPAPADWDGPDGIHEAILGFTERATQPGEVFLYKSVTTDVLAWAIARATGQRWIDGVSERIWGPMGAADDAAVILDNHGIAVSSGGMSCTARDLARFGRMLARSGRVGEGADERQALPAAVADDLTAGGEPYPGSGGGYATREGWTFHRHCWNMQRVMGAFMPMGVHGQRLFCHPEKDLVVAKFGSHPVTGNVYTDVSHESLYRQLIDRC